MIRLSYPLSEPPSPPSRRCLRIVEGTIPGDKDERVVRFVNCRIVRDGCVVHEDLWVHRGKIIDPQSRFWEVGKDADIRIDCAGLLLAPGFIDLQLNGGFGVDFSSLAAGQVELGIHTVARQLLAYGVTSFCPTLVTSEPATYQAIIPEIRKRDGSCADGAGVLGAHLEGPFISTLKYGAHKQEFVRTMQSENGTGTAMSSVLECYGNRLESVAIVTLAPELPNALGAVKGLCERGIVVSAGHSMATIDDAERAASNGLRLVTHLYNAMSPFHHRDPGLIGLLASDAVKGQIYYSIIVDGIHAHPAAVKMSYKTNPSGCVLVTDSIAAMGLQPGSYRLGEMSVTITDRAEISGTHTLAGSIATMDQCVSKFKKFTGCSIVEAIHCASLHPALCMGLSGKKGSLHFGADADIVAIDDSGDDIAVLATIVMGGIAWQKQQQQQCSS
eukprot:Opistho-2@2353